MEFHLADSILGGIDVIGRTLTILPMVDVPQVAPITRQCRQRRVKTATAIGELAPPVHLFTFGNMTMTTLARPRAGEQDPARSARHQEVEQGFVAIARNVLCHLNGKN
ncbi:hypothetical protein ThidrDRAFT_3698 [Thiorhodococcus drewsii AZ1]|uniref:Uncharacterized protein n=1 Tax=Thiorhodococcus drewsii AZ1 TaxID=765913 RepID=G2E5Y5_9GAMM|nr:hypothetical protein ThidrDRAFT_3698 [Thiorhodococcus drewsii AZ1]